MYWGPGDRSTGLVAGTAIVAADIADGVFPDGQGLCPTIAIKLGGTAETLDVRTFACAQVAYPAD